MSKTVPAMPERITATIRAERLPEEIRAKLRTRPLPGQTFRVTVEAVEETEAEKLEALRAHVARGLADDAAGRLHDDADVFDELQARFPEP